MAHFDASADKDRAANLPTNHQPSIDMQPPIGQVPPLLLAEQAAEGHRRAAWRLMHRIMEGDPNAIAAVTSLDDDRLVQHLLEFIALGTWAGKPFIAPLSVRTAHAKTHLRTLFLPIFRRNPARTMRVLLASVHDTRPAMREEGIHILSTIADNAVVPVLLEALNDPIHSVRMQAVKALGRIGDSSVVPALLHILHSVDDEQMGNQIFLALIDLGSAAVPTLIAESNNSSAWIRWHCVRALGRICDDRALPVLVRALADQDHAVAWVAAKELPNFGKMSIKPVLHLLMTTEIAPWLTETSSYVLRVQYQRYKELRPYLKPLHEAMHSVGYRIATPNAAHEALEQLETSGLLAPSS
jgi:hypothetical protein